MRRAVPRIAAFALLLLVLLPAPADARTRKGKKARHHAKRTPATRPYYGPPAPTPLPYLRAAGACMAFTPGEYLVVAEVGSTGRVFRIDGETVISADVRKGARVRVLYVEGAAGPVARKVMPGPEAASPQPRTP